MKPISAKGAAALPLLLLAATALTPIATAQGSFSLALSPTHGAAPPGAEAFTAVVLVNPGPIEVEVRLGAAGAPGVQVVFPLEQLRLPPGEEAQVPARFLVDENATEGERRLVLFANWSDARGAHGSVSATYALDVSASPPPGHAAMPSISPGHANLSAAPGGDAVRVPFTVSNPFEMPIQLRFETHLPLGWSVRFEPARLEVPPRANASVEAVFAAGSDAVDGEGLLRAGDHGSWLEVPLRLNAAPAAPSDDSSSSPLSASRPTTPANLDALAEAPKELTTLRVEPAEVRLKPGGTAAALLIVVHQGTAPLALAPTLALPGGFTGSIVQPSAPLASGERIELPILLQAPDAPWDSPASAWAHAEPGEPAPFTLVLAHAQPPSDEDARAQAPAGGAGVPVREGLLALGLTGAGVVALALPRIRRAWPALLAPLYTRLRPDRLLDHPARARILDELRAHPAIALAELQRRTGLANGALAHHLAQLERARLVVAYRDGSQRRLRLPGEAVAAPEAPLPERLVRELAAAGPLGAAELARRVGVSRQLAHHHLKALRAQGRVAVEGRLVRVKDVGAALVADA